MTLRRIALIAVSLLALSGCAVYDEGYRHPGLSITPFTIATTWTATTGGRPA